MIDESVFSARSARVLKALAPEKFAALAAAEPDLALEALLEGDQTLPARGGATGRTARLHEATLRELRRQCDRAAEPTRLQLAKLERTELISSIATTVGASVFLTTFVASWSRPVTIAVAGLTLAASLVALVVRYTSRTNGVAPSEAYTRLAATSRLTAAAEYALRTWEAMGFPPGDQADVSAQVSAAVGAFAEVKMLLEQGEAADE